MSERTTYHESPILLDGDVARPAQPIERDTEFHLAEENQFVLSDYMKAKDVYDVLAQHYPDHGWGVHVSEKQGIIVIKNTMMSGLFGHVLHLDKITSPTDQAHKVKMAGGEILERMKMARGRFDGERWASLEQTAAGTPFFFKD